jgi:hypothetical protein
MTEWELFVGRMMFFGSMLVVALFARARGVGLLCLQKSAHPQAGYHPALVT